MIKTLVKLSLQFALIIFTICINDLTFWLYKGRRHIHTIALVMGRYAGHVE